MNVLHNIYYDSGRKALSRKEGGGEGARSSLNQMSVAKGVEPPTSEIILRGPEIFLEILEIIARIIWIFSQKKQLLIAEPLHRYED